MGLSKYDAEYYATLDDKFADLEKNNIIIDLSNSKEITPEEIASDPITFKNKILSLDPSAIKAVLQSPVYSQGMDDIEELMVERPRQLKYVVQYPDGSSITVVNSPGQKKDNYSIKPKVYDEDVYWEDNNCNGAGPGTCENASTEWTFSSPVGWAKASVFNLDYTTTFAPYDYVWTSTIGYYDVGAASYGSVTYSTPNKNTKEPAI